jgi:hypothetical protein
MSEIPVHSRPRRLADWINPTGARKVHSLVDKVYQRKNLEMAWEKVKANRGSGGVDGQNLAAFGAPEDADCPRAARVRFSGVPNCANQREVQTSGEQNSEQAAPERDDCLPHGEIDPALPGPGAGVDAALCPVED